MYGCAAIEKALGKPVGLEAGSGAEAGELSDIAGPPVCGADVDGQIRRVRRCAATVETDLRQPELSVVGSLRVPHRACVSRGVASAALSTAAEELLRPAAAERRDTIRQAVPEPLGRMCEGRQVVGPPVGDRLPDPAVADERHVISKR